EELEAGIRGTNFSDASIPVYQNVTAAPETSATNIQANLIAQLTAPVRWTQTIEQMIADGCGSFTEVGPGRVLQGLMRRINRKMEAKGLQTLPESV
ncbi:MAG: [acyl-carrier-protein] S-malonyltransferase, partial [Bacteroidota bacterium]